MKKFILMISIVCFFFVTVVEAKSKEKLWWGIILTALGTGLAVDGFSWEKDISNSNPQITITKNTWWKEKIINWWTHHDWQVKNTGNVTITDVDVRVSYYDRFGLLIDDYYFNNYYLHENGTAGWNDWLTNCGATEPYYAYLSYEIDSYIPKMKQKNLTQGYIGIAWACSGLYLIVDYAISNTKYSKFMNKYELELRLVNKGYPNLLLSKRI